MAFLPEIKTSNNVEKQALKIIKTLKNHGFQAVYAGGYVRDMILGHSSNDIDIATDATPDQVESLFEKTIPVGKSFGVIVVVEDGIEFEIATFRNDGVYFDGRHPESVSFSSIEEDAKRRDITINGMFYDPIEDKILDFVKGKQDLENKVIRFIGDAAKRIDDDKLRMLRVIRFAVRLDFEIEPETFVIIQERASEIKQISAERIAEELVKVLRLRKPRRVLELLLESGLLKYILPEVVALKDVPQPPQFHPEGARVRKIL